MSSVWDTEFLVDLGEDLDLPPTGSWASSRRSTIRRLRLAVPLLALLILVTAAAPPPPAPLRLAAHIPVGFDASVMVEGPNLYVYDIAEGHNGIRAYRLEDGALQWSASTAELATETTMSYIDGRVIVSMADTDARGEHTVAFDAATGQRLWTSDLGFAVVTESGVLVESAPPPPGFNFPGTVPSETFSLLDASTGRTRWSVDAPVNCLTDIAGRAGGPATVLVELCLNSARLTEIDLSDGDVAAARDVGLGDPEANLFQPPADQMDDPELFVINGTVLVAHADSPTPTVDAYDMNDLRQRWTGLSIAAPESLDPCGPALCVSDELATGSVVDPLTGKRIGVIPPRNTATPGDGALVLVPLRQAASPSDVTPLPSIAAGTSSPLPPARDSRSTLPAGNAIWLARWHVTETSSARLPAGAATPIEFLPGVDALSCIEIAGYLGCTTTPDHISLWELR